MTLVGCGRFTGTPTQNRVVILIVGNNETTPLLQDSLLGGFTKPSESRISETKLWCVRDKWWRHMPELRIIEGRGETKSQVSSGLLQTAQTWANAGVCGGLCACAVGGTFD